MEVRNLGTFNVSSGKVIVSDPCYDRGTLCAGLLENVKNGTWNASVDVLSSSETHGWGKRVGTLYAYTKHSLSSFQQHTVAKFEVGVDSGQAGIFCDSVYPHGSTGEYGEDGFYGICCNLTLSNEQAGVLLGGVVSSSGYGDGGYTCSYLRDENGEIVSIRITFIRDEEELDNDF